MTALDIAILVPLVPALFLIITWWLPWERWSGWSRLPKMVLGPYLLYCAFGAWHFHMQRWVAPTLVILGLGVCAFALKQMADRTKAWRRS